MRKYMQYVLRPGTGRTVPQASILIKSYPSTIISANATVYSDDAGLVPISQPFLATSSGLLQFYAADGRYDIYVTYADISYTLTDVWIFDPNSPIAGLASLQTLGYVTTRTEALLSSETAIPTFLGHPDTPPVTPHTYDNEFGAAFAAPWANYNHDGNTLLTVANSRARLFQSITTRTAVGVERSFTPDTGYMITSLVRLGAHPGVSGGELGGERPFFGLGVKDNFGDISAIGLRYGAQGISVFHLVFNSVGISSSEGFQEIGTNAAYVRIRKPVGSNFFLEWSADGFTWITVKSLATLSAGTPVSFGIYAFASFDAGGVVDCYSDFTRYTTTLPY